MRVTVLQKIPEDPQVGLAWNNLVMRTEHPEIFFTHQWALAAGRAFCENLRPLLFLMYDADQLSGVAALATDRQSPRAAFFLAASTADYCDILSTPGNRGAVLRSLLDEIKRLGLRDLILANLPSDSCTFRELPRVSSSCGLHFTSRAAYDCGVIDFSTEQQRQALLRTVVRKEREKRGLKKLATVGPVQVIPNVRPEQIETSLGSIVSAQVARFLASDRVSPLVHPERRAFLKELTGLLAREDWLRISQLQVNGQPVAWNYGFRFGDRWFWYLPTFQIEREDASPGSCLLRLLVEEVCRDSSLRWLDLGLGDESYKDRFANAVRQTRYVQLSNSLVRHLAAIGRQGMASGCAHYPRVSKWLRRMRDLSRALASRVKERGLAATVGHAIRRIAKSLISQREILLFEAPEIGEPENSGTRLVPLTWELLARAAIDNAGDTDTLRYLMRCAKRLKRPSATGFLLRAGEERSVHFLWVGSYSDFNLFEIDHKLESCCPGTAMIFDCWTPAADRGRGHYVTAIRSAADNLRRQGRKTWIFSTAANVSSLCGILQAGFEYRFSMARCTRLGHSRVIRRDTTKSLP